MHFIFKIGVFSLAEKDWMQSLSTVHFEDVHYEPYVLAARRLAKELRNRDVNFENYLLY